MKKHFKICPQIISRLFFRLDSKPILSLISSLISCLISCLISAGVFLFFFALASVLTAPKASAQTAALEAYSDPESFLLSRKDKLFELHEADLDEAEQNRRLCRIMEESFEMPHITKYVLGRHWRKITEDQRRDFALFFKQAMIRQVQVYREMFEESIEESHFEVKSQREAKPGIYNISTLVILPSGQINNVQWNIKKTAPGQYKIRDISVEGISFIINFRQSYSSLIRSKGGFDPFLEHLREKANFSPGENPCRP